MPRKPFIVLLAAVLSLTISCSNSEDPGETGVIKETQDKIAQEAVDYIKGPMDQAKAVTKLANEHTRQIEEAQKSQ